MGKRKVGLVIPQPEDQKWDTVWKTFRFPNLTLPTLAALIPEEEWEIEIQDELVGPIDFDRNYDLVLLTITTCVAAKAYAVARMFRDRSAKVVVGGIHPSVLPEEAGAHADAVVVGEGELTLPEVLRDFSRGSLGGIYKMPHQVETWDRRIPRWDLLNEKGYYLRESLTATRGCNHSCSFCSINLALGGGYREKPAHEVARMLEAIEGQFIMFWDDDLLSDPRYANELCAALKPLKKMWMGQMSLNVARRPQTLNTLAESGCVGMFVGLESLNQDSLRSVEKRNRVETYEDLVRRVHDHGIDIHAGFVVGMDYDDASTFERTVEWANRMGLSGAIWRILTPYPGTRLFDELEASGRLITKDWTYYDGENVVYRPARMSVEELYWGHKWAKRRYYSFRSIGERILRRMKLTDPRDLLSAIGLGLGYRSMFLFPNDNLDVDIYRDGKHLPPPPIPIPYRFPYSRKQGIGQVVMDRLAAVAPF